MISESKMTFDDIFSEIFNSIPKPQDNISISEFPLSSVQNDGLNEFKQYCLDNGYKIEVSYPRDNLVQVKVHLK